MKALVIGAVLFMTPFLAYADTYFRNPTGSGVYGSMSFNVGVDDFNTLCADTISLHPSLTSWTTALQVENESYWVTADSVPQSFNTHTFAYEADDTARSISSVMILLVPPGSTGHNQANNGGDGFPEYVICMNNGDQVFLEGSDNGPGLFTFQQVPIPPERPFDFFGSTTPAVILQDVQGGVQRTGQQNWPLLAFLGVPTAFGIAGRAVYLIIRASRH